jgi:glutamate carboxypeptidase
MSKTPLRLIAALALAAAPLHAQSLTRAEQAMRDYIAATKEQHIALLEQVVNIPSGSLNPDGVRAVGRVFQAAFDSLGFTTRLVEQPAAMRRGPHLVAEKRGKPGAPRLLLIGHLDTVFEGENQRFVREDSIARGAGTNDMKGGDVVIVWALRAMQRAGTLADAHLTVVFTGDEESPGEPIADSRRVLLDAARNSDLALGFEGGSLAFGTVGRRGASSWRLTVRAQQGHSSGIFRGTYGAGYELARILDGFRTALSEEPGLTFNPGVILAGERVQYDTMALAGTAAGKTNIIAPQAVAEGDLRFLRESQKDSARARMRAIVAQSLPGTSAEIAFADLYPAMDATTGNRRALAHYDSASRALGYPAVEALDPRNRGAGDLSFVAPLIDGLDGLGAWGRGAHSPNESVNLHSLAIQAERAAVFLTRVTNTDRGSWARVTP